MVRVRNEEVRRRVGIESELASRVDQRVFRLFGQVERMDEYRMARRVLMAEMSEGRVWGRPTLGWMDGVKEALGCSRMTVDAARQCTKNRKEEWRTLVHMYNAHDLVSRSNVRLFPVLFRTALSRSGGCTCRGVECRWRKLYKWRNY